MKFTLFTIIFFGASLIAGQPLGQPSKNEPALPVVASITSVDLGGTKALLKYSIKNISSLPVLIDLRPFNSPWPSYTMEDASGRRFISGTGGGSSEAQTMVTLHPNEKRSGSIFLSEKKTSKIKSMKYVQIELQFSRLIRSSSELLSPPQDGDVSTPIFEIRNGLPVENRTAH